MASDDFKDRLKALAIAHGGEAAEKAEAKRRAEENAVDARRAFSFLRVSASMVVSTFNETMQGHGVNAEFDEGGNYDRDGLVGIEPHFSFTVVGSSKQVAAAKTTYRLEPGDPHVVKVWKTPHPPGAENSVYLSDLDSGRFEADLVDLADQVLTQIPSM